jgi:hypothetical protein
VKIGIVGYQGSGKSALFEWLTGDAPDPALAHTLQSAMVAVPEPRVDGLCAIYSPKKITLASIEVVDTPGLSRDHEGSAGKLAQIREAGCLVVVVAAFAGNDAAADLARFEDDLLLTDLDMVTRRIERLGEQRKKARGDQLKEIDDELTALAPLGEALENGQAVRALELSPTQQRVVRSFQLLTEKPRLVVVNSPEDDVDPDKYRQHVAEGTPLFAIPLDLERELVKMDESERAAFYEEMGAQPSDRDALIRGLLDASGQMLFFTAGDKEVRTWLIPRGATAVDAAGSIHTDLARGFIRAETMNVDDLVRLGSEREIKAQNLMRSEHKDYVIQDGDILLIRHN